MKKTFPLQIEGKHPDFDCQFGLSEDTAQAVHLANLITCIDSAAKDNAAQVYVQVLAKHGVRTKRPASGPYESAAPHSDPASQAPQGN